ncbi:MAG TPA: hypothetical protein VHR55_06565 [Candidatus Limnocylindria bacterium]|nr:hypothetical protein [Candidatus Limnocylindria bacterium]
MVYARARSEFVVPRPSELHATRSASATTTMSAPSPAVATRRAGLDVLRHRRRRSQAVPIEREDGGRAWRQELLAAVARQRVPLLVATGAALTGTAAALFFAAR